MNSERYLNLERAKTIAADCGAAATGFVRAAAVDDEAIAAYDKWISAGNHAAMDYMARNGDLRADPRMLLDGAQSMIVMAFNYYSDLKPAMGIARYALGQDYHTALRRQLRPLTAWLAEEGYDARLCIDSAPLRERYWAVKAGLGFIGRNAQLIVPGTGSYCFIATVITTARLSPDFQAVAIADGCGDCRRCIDSCPGRAITAARSIDARRCISYLTIEASRTADRDRQWPEGVRRGNRVFGCDTCQDVCPYNAEAPQTEISRFEPRREVFELTEESLGEMTEKEFDTRLAGSPLRRAGLAHLLSTLSHR